MMGHDTFSTTQGNSEGSVAPLAPRPATKSPWAPIARKVAAITLGGLGLAAIGALSMAHTGNPATATTPVSAASASGVFASVLAPTEWIAGGPVAVSASASAAPPTSHAGTTPSPANVDADTHAATGGGPQPPHPCPPTSPTSTSNPSTSTPGASSSAASLEVAGAGRLPDGRVVLNLASASDLTTLPGIGQKRAEAILALRTKLKGFRKLSDLLRVKGIGVKSLRKLEPKLVLDPPSGPS